MNVRIDVVVAESVDKNIQMIIVAQICHAGELVSC
jgi:hypothetical protein